MNYLELSINSRGSVWAPVMAPGEGRWLGSAPYMPGRREHQPSQVLSMCELCGLARVMKFPWQEAGITCVSDGVMTTPGRVARGNIGQRVLARISDDHTDKDGVFHCLERRRMRE